MRFLFVGWNVRSSFLHFEFPARFAEAGDDDDDESKGDETVERVIERLREVNHSYLEKSKLVSCIFFLSLNFESLAQKNGFAELLCQIQQI